MPLTSATASNPPALSIALRSQSMRGLSARNSPEVKPHERKRIGGTGVPAMCTLAPMGEHSHDIYIGAHLIAVLARLGVTPTELSERTGIAYSHISNITRDEKPLTMKIGNRIAQALGIPLAEVIGHAADKPIASGRITSAGELMSTDADIPPAIPGLFLLDAVFPGLADAGSIVQILRSDDWIAGRHLAIRYADGRVRLRLAIDDD